MRSVPFRALRLALLLAAASMAQQQPQSEGLATQLETAKSDPDRAAILAANPDLKADILKIVTAHAADRFTKTDWDGALGAYRAILAIAVSNNDEMEMARMWRRIGLCLSRKDDIQGALEMHNKALEASTRLGDKATQAEALLGLTSLYLPMGRLDEAEQAARRGIVINTELGDKKRAAAIMINLSTILGERGDQAAKAEMLREAILACEAGGFDDYLVAAVNNLGVVYYDQGEYERSLQYIRRALELFEKQKTPDRFRISFLHSNVAVMLARLGNEKEALEEYNRAEASAVAMGDQPTAIHARFNRATLFRQLGDLPRALTDLRAVSAYYDTSAYRTDALRSNGEFTQALLAAGLSKEAVEVGEKAVKEARVTGGPDLLWLTLHPLGRAYLEAGKREQARAAFLEAIGAVESIRLSGGEDEKENFFHEKAIPYHMMVRLLLEEKNNFEALRYAERAKARLLLDVLRGGRAEIARAMSDAEKQRERELSAAVAKIDSQLSREGQRATPELLEQRTNATIELDRFHAALYQAHPELRVKRGEFPPIEMAQIGELLRDNDTALLEYTVTKDAVYLFSIVREGGKPRLESYVLRDPAMLPAQIEGYQAQLAARDLQYKTTAKALYARVLGPAAAALRKKKRIVIVPDGPLWNLPFQALVSPQGKHLIEDAAVFYAPSLTAAREMLLLPRAGRDRGHTLLATGPPAASGNLPALAESEREVRQIGQVYGAASGSVLIGAQADKQRWKASAPDYRILHMATHGVLNANNPLYSYLVMSRVPGGKEDSVLPAREILGMKLDAEITVLSACEMARGRFRFGEGLIGMSWAFLVAGTPTTVVSQWKVDSASTSQLMVAFHRNLKVAGQGPITGRAEALQGAVLQLLATPQYKHPFYWAGFVMIGNGY